MKRFTVLLVSAWLVAMIYHFVGAQTGGRITLLFDSSTLPSTVTQLIGKCDTIHATTGGYTRGLIQSLSLISGDSLYIHIVADTPSTGAAANGITPAFIVEARQALDSLSSTGVNNRGYINLYHNNPWTRASFDTAGVTRGYGVQDTLFTGAWALKNLNKTGYIEYRIRNRSTAADTGTSTTRVVNMRWRLYGMRPW